MAEVIELRTESELIDMAIDAMARRKLRRERLIALALITSYRAPVHVVTDGWFTPVEIYQDLISFFGPWIYRDGFIDPTTCAEASARIKIAHIGGGIFFFGSDAFALDICPDRKYGLCFSNPPYSRDAGGAESFVRHLFNQAFHNVFLVNYGRWIARLPGTPKVGLVSTRIRFVPSAELAKKLAEDYAKKHPDAPPKTSFDSPRYDNAFIYYGPLDVEDLPKNLGGYDIRWLRST